ncbi:MAG: hypothetical protein J6I49_04765 [Bacteroidales bacterium]|nr:hypothetical protein [Bacteroidales bacterium]
MKKTMLLLLAAVGLLASCHRSGSGFEPYGDGLTPDRVRAAVQAGGYDYALIGNLEDRQVVVYAWRDSAIFHTVELFPTDSTGHGTLEQDEVYSADTAWHFLPLKGGNWRFKHNDNSAIRYGLKTTPPKASAEGVAFDLKAYVLTQARCLFVAADKSLETDALLTRPEVQPLLQYAIIHHLSDRNISVGDIVFDSLLVGDEDWDEEWDDDADTSQCAVRMELLEQQANANGFNAIEIRHSTSDADQHDSCTFHAVRSFPRRDRKCHRAMEQMQSVSLRLGASFHEQHHADERGRHTGCEITCKF